MRGVLELVAREPLELHAERELDEAVGEPHVLRQQRAVQVGADHVAAQDALEAVPVVVAVAAEHAAERVLVRSEVGAPAVVLEAGDHARPGAEVGLDRAVADQPLAGLADGAQVHEAHARELLALHLVGVAEQLVAAAHGEHHGAAVGRAVEGVALRLGHVVGHGGLVAVLAAAHVEEVVRVRVERLAEARGGMLEAEPAPLAARAQHGDVAAVGVDVHQLGIEREHPQRRHRTTVLPM